MCRTDRTLHQLLTKRELANLLELINMSINCASESDLLKLVFFLRELVPHDYAICGLAETQSDGMISSYKTLNVDYPEAWIDHYVSKEYNLCDPVFATNFSKFGLQQWSETYKFTPPPQNFLRDAHDFGLVHGYTFGIKNRSKGMSNSCSLFSLSGPSVEEQYDRTRLVLNYVLPHYHQALTRVTVIPNEKENNSPMPAISKREREILLLLKDGKNSWAVSTMLNISERTVNFHVGNIIHKLGAESRLHAVAIAAGLKLINLD